MFSRRNLLRASALGAGAALLRPGRAALPQEVAAEDLRFIFVFLWGGWDVTRVFVPAFDNPSVATEADASTTTFSDGFTFVDSPARPSVASFFEDWRDRTVILNGIGLQAIDHYTNLRLMLTGANDGGLADWPAILAGAAIGADGTNLYALPHLVLAGPSYAGRHGNIVVRTGGSGQLEALLNGDVLRWHDACTEGCPWGEPSIVQEGIVDRYLRGRAAAEVQAARTAAGARRMKEFQASLTLGASLKDLAHVVTWELGGAGPDTQLGVDGVIGDDESSLFAQFSVAVSALSRSASRCVSVQDLNHTWDTHFLNADQSENFESLFQALSYLMDLMQLAPGRSTDRLIDETVVVVLSEMGRSPQDAIGKDHWPYTSAMLVGPRLLGGRVIGAMDELFSGQAIDLTTGELDPEGGRALTPGVLGATLLSLAGITEDHEDYPPDCPPLQAILPTA